MESYDTFFPGSNLLLALLLAALVCFQNPSCRLNHSPCLIKDHPSMYTFKQYPLSHEHKMDKTKYSSLKVALETPKLLKTTIKRPWKIMF
jgi:hypothetical protein